MNDKNDEFRMVIVDSTPTHMLSSAVHQVVTAVYDLDVKLSNEKREPTKDDYERVVCMVQALGAAYDAIPQAFMNGRAMRVDNGGSRPMTDIEETCIREELGIEVMDLGDLRRPN